MFDLAMDWVEDFDYENGCYYNICLYCNEIFRGVYGRVVCKGCYNNNKYPTETNLGKTEV